MHTTEELAAFQKGEVRHLYAAYRDGRDGLFFLEPGQAQSVREFAKEYLRCAVVECESPALTTVGPTLRRHGFKHLRSSMGDHGGESAFHIGAKGLIERWARKQDATVIARQEQDPDGTRQRRTDVLVTWPDGAQLAFEPQYSPIPVENWTARHDWYAKRSIPDVWMFGHSGFHLKTAGFTGSVKLSLVQLAAARTRPILWINPQQELIATLDISALKRWNGRESIVGMLLLIPVDECVLTRDGLKHPEIDRCHQQLIRMISDAESPAPAPVPDPAPSDNFWWTEDAEPEAPDTAARQENAWASGKQARNTDARSRRFGADNHASSAGVLTPRQLAKRWASTWQSREIAGQAGELWLTTAEGRATAARLGGWPESLPYPKCLPLPAHAWQAFIYERHVLTCVPGRLIDVDAVCSSLIAEFADQVIPGTCELDPHLVRDEVVLWFEHAAGELVGRLGGPGAHMYTSLAPSPARA